MRSILFFFLIIVLSDCSPTQENTNSELQSGPMLGYSEMREALIWVQTKREVNVYMSYSDVEKPQVSLLSNKVDTRKEEAFIARLLADPVEPGRTYNYTVFIDNKALELPYPTVFSTPPLWRWRGNPPDFTMLTSSCAYINQTEYDRPGKPYGGDYLIFTNMAKQKADFMLWLGDNVYLREPDWNSWTGIENRYTHTRSLPELQPFLAAMPHYAIWDDHDYGPDNSNKSFFNKNQTFKAFKLFSGNPTFGVGDIEGAISSFQWGDADFFLLDNRWYRDPDEIIKENKTILGEKQLNWLLENLVTSRANFKMVAMGGQFLTDAPNGENYSVRGFEKEREKIINFIYQHKIKNVVFITGDVHFSEISVLKIEGNPTIYDLTFSTMSAGVNTNGASWNNSYRVPGTVVMERNYGMIKFTGAEKARKLIVVCYNTDNVKKWERIIEME